MSRFREPRYLKSVYSVEELEECVAEVAFVGRSNVGKSTALNAVCRQKDLAKTSQTSGRTRTINIFLVAKNKWIVDLPGYGFAAGPKEDMAKFKHMLKSYLVTRKSLRLVLLLVDGNVGATKLDEEMSSWLLSHDVPFTVVANKCDKVGASKHRQNHQAVADALGIRIEDVRWVSAEKGLGISALHNEVADALELP